MPEIVRATALRHTRRPNKHAPKAIVIDPTTMRNLKIDPLNPMWIGKIEQDVSGLPCDIYVVIERPIGARFKQENLRADQPAEILMFNATEIDSIVDVAKVEMFDPNKRPA
jgi:hypothetical protein